MKIIPVAARVAARSKCLTVRSGRRSIYPGIELWLGILLAWCGSSVLLAQTGSVVTVNADRALVINGRKVFPIGFSPSPPTYGTTPTGKDALQELRDAGGLLFRMNQTTDWSSQVISDQQAALDWAAQHGMYVWLNLRELSQFPSTDTITPVSLLNIVNTFKNHPALGLWKNYDEAWWGGLGRKSPERLQRHQTGGYQPPRGANPRAARHRGGPSTVQRRGGHFGARHLTGRGLGG